MDKIEVPLLSIHSLNSLLSSPKVAVVMSLLYICSSIKKMILSFQEHKRALICVGFFININDIVFFLYSKFHTLRPIHI